MRKSTLAWIVAVCASSYAAAATPPAGMNYQGVLRTASGEPANGSFDMVFRLFDAETGGDEIMIEYHTAFQSAPVTVVDGMFNVVLASGTRVDGSGPGFFVAYPNIFADYQYVWLEIEIEGEILSPRTWMLSAPYAFNASYFGGRSPGEFVSKTGPQSMSGKLSISDGAPLALKASFVDDSPSLGSLAGARFESFVDSTDVRVAWSGNGIHSTGAADGGIFHGNGGWGIQSYGSSGGGYFSNSVDDAEALVSSAGTGINAWGTFASGEFSDTDSGNYGRVGYSTYKIFGTGTVSFVQNHPEDPDRVVVNHAPESSEVAVYTRGSAKLGGGALTIPLEDTFRWVANPHIGLTANLTPRGASCSSLHVLDVSTTSLEVAAEEGCAGIEVDYIVWGLRIGFENAAPIQPKEQEAYIPSMTDHDRHYASDPQLRQFNAFERYKKMEIASGAEESGEEFAARTSELVSRIGRFGALRPTNAEAPAPRAVRARTERAQARRDPGETPPPVSGVSEHGDFRETEPWIVTEPVDAGDLLALDPTKSGQLRRAASGFDSMVVGIAAHPSELGEAGLTARLVANPYTTVNADARFGTIEPGDLLTLSPTPGHAMRGLGDDGVVVGRAIDGLEIGTGAIRIRMISR